MRVQAEPTDIFVTVDGVECRVPHRILFPDTSTSFSELENDLVAVKPPQQLEKKK